MTNKPQANEAPTAAKVPYEKPVLVVHGKVEKLTLATGAPTPPPS